MFFRPILAAFVLGFSFPVAADPLTMIQVVSQSQSKSYGIYLRAPAEGCVFVRYRLSGIAMRSQTLLLRAGQARVVRLGAGLAPGHHAVQIAPMGCRQAPAMARQVVLRKASPDHGARALAVQNATRLNG